MVRFSVDSNLLVYSIDTATPEKHAIARGIMVGALRADAVLTAQALGEYLNVVRRKFRPALPAALSQAQRWTTLFPIVPTTMELPFKALLSAERLKIQYWDALICEAARAGGASILLSEDMKDGLIVEDLTVLNPFNPTNRQRIDKMLTPAA